MDEQFNQQAFAGLLAHAPTSLPGMTNLLGAKKKSRKSKKLKKSNTQADQDGSFVSEEGTGSRTGGESSSGVNVNNSHPNSGVNGPTAGGSSGAGANNRSFTGNSGSGAGGNNNISATGNNNQFDTSAFYDDDNADRHSEGDQSRILPPPGQNMSMRSSQKNFNSVTPSSVAQNVMPNTTQVTSSPAARHSVSDTIFTGVSSAHNIFGASKSDIQKMQGQANNNVTDPYDSRNYYDAYDDYGAGNYYNYGGDWSAAEYDAYNYGNADAYPYYYSNYGNDYNYYENVNRSGSMVDSGSGANLRRRTTTFNSAGQPIIQGSQDPIAERNSKRQSFQVVIDDHETTKGLGGDPVPRQPTQYDEIVEAMSLLNMAMGVFILWFCWLAFNAGSTRNISSVEGMRQACRALINTILSGSTGGMTAVLIANRFGNGRWDTAAFANGILAGCAAITAGCDEFEPYAAVVMGFLDLFVLEFDSMASSVLANL